MSCGDLYRSSKCRQVKGCQWKGFYCTGEARACNYMGKDRVACETAGCSYDYSYPVVEGSAHTCEDMPISACEVQVGCSLSCGEGYEYVSGKCVAVE